MTNDHQIKSLKTVFILLLLSIGASFWFDYNQNHMATGIDFARINRRIGDWMGTDVLETDREKQQADQNELIIRIYEEEDKKIHLVAIQEGNDRHRVHSPVDCYTAGGWTVVNKTNLVLGNDPSKIVRRMRVDKGPTSRIVYFWFTNGEERSASFEGHLLLYLKNALINRNANSWAYFQVSADIKDDGNAIDLILERFIDELDQQHIFVRTSDPRLCKAALGT